MDVQVQVREGLRLECVEGCPPEFHALLLQCWDKQWKRRPTFTNIKNIIMKFGIAAKDKFPPIRDIGRALESWVPGMGPDEMVGRAGK